MSWVFSSPRVSRSTAHPWGPRVSGSPTRPLWVIVPHTITTQVAVQSFLRATRRRTHTELTHTMQERPSAPREPHGPPLFLPRAGRTSPSHSGTPQATRTEFTPTPQSFSAPPVRTLPARRPGDSIRSTAPGSFLAAPRSAKQPDSPNALLRNTRTNANCVNATQATYAKRPKQVQQREQRIATQATQHDPNCDTSYASNATRH